MSAFGSPTAPVRTHPNHPININTPDGFMTDPPGDLWWWGLHFWWEATVPASLTRGTAIIVNPLVRMPWLIRTPAGDQLAPGDPGYPVWLSDPQLLNGSSGGRNTGDLPQLWRMDRFDLWARWLRDALWLGLGVLVWRPDSAGQPLAGTVLVLPPTTLADNGARIAFEGELHDVDPQTGRFLASSRPPGRQEYQVTLLRHSLPGGVFGRHRAELQLAGRLNAYANETFDSGVPSGVLGTDQPINQTQADAIRSEWEATQARRRMAVLGSGAKYQQVVMSPLDSEVVAMSRLSNEKVAHMLELPAWQLDASTNSTTYTNAQDWRQDSVDGPLASWSARLEESLAAVLPWGWSIDVDFNAFTKPMTGSETGDGTPTAA